MERTAVPTRKKLSEVTQDGENLFVKTLGGVYFSVPKGNYPADVEDIAANLDSYVLVSRESSLFIELA
jgi:hypothetical protein